MGKEVIMKIVVRIDELANGCGVGECELFQLESIVRFMKEQIFIVDDDAYKFSMLQIFPENETAELIITK